MDSVTLNPGNGGDAIAADEIAGVKVQRVKLIHGADGVNDGDVATSNPLPAKQTCSTGALSNVPSSATSGTMLASNPARRGAIVHNDSTATLYLKYGATASTNSYTVKILPDQSWEMPLPAYTGIIDGIWSAANGNARVTELT
ncbi:MAG TPA: hypothetical protein VG734_25840 [Lacunisphaera sp.]|nr:hypothetical protein [Lacunisphaera sp.]